MKLMIKLLMDLKAKLPAGHFSSHEGRDCCQVEQKSSEFRVQPHRCEVSAREGGYSVLVFSSAVLFLWYPCLHLWVVFLTFSFLTSISAVFLTPFSWTVQYNFFCSATVIPSCQPRLLLGIAPSLSNSCQEQPHPHSGSTAIFQPIRSAPQITSFHWHSTNLCPATILTSLWLSSNYSIIKITMEHN